MEKKTSITLFVSKVRDEIEDMLKTMEDEKPPKEELSALLHSVSF